MSLRLRCRKVPLLAACVVLSALANPLVAVAAGVTRQGTKANVACKKPHAGRVRCTMTLKSGAGINGTVTMRITRGKLLVATGTGRVSAGKATLTMRVLHAMTAGRYTVAMVITASATMVLQLK